MLHLRKIERMPITAALQGRSAISCISKPHLTEQIFLAVEGEALQTQINLLNAFSLPS